jgi:hypothetical protein
MKNFSMPRLAVVLWFLNFSIFSVFSYIGGSHDIFYYVVYATIFVVIEMVCLGLIEDMA